MKITIVFQSHAHKYKNFNISEILEKALFSGKDTLPLVNTKILEDIDFFLDKYAHEIYYSHLNKGSIDPIQSSMHYTFNYR